MKRTHRLLGLLLAMTMIMGMLMSGTALAADKLTEISVMLFDRGNIPSDQGYVDDNKWTQYANEEMAKLGIKVNYILVPRSEENTKVPVMMASGTRGGYHDDVRFRLCAQMVSGWRHPRYLPGTAGIRAADYLLRR